MNWVEKKYPVGTRVQVPDMRTGELADAEVIGHYLGGGFQTRHVAGIAVMFDDHHTQRVAAAFLDEDGNSRA